MVRYYSSSPFPEIPSYRDSQSKHFFLLDHRPRLEARLLHILLPFHAMFLDGRAVTQMRHDVRGFVAQGLEEEFFILGEEQHAIEENLAALDVASSQRQPKLVGERNLRLT